MMAKRYKERTVASKDEYTFQMLLNDIHESASESDEDSQAGDKTERERKSRLIVMQMLVTKANECRSANQYNEEELRKAIDIMVNTNVSLAGYIFFVSQNPQFDYSWNYLRKRENNYKEFLVECIYFLDNVLADINMLVGKHQTHKDVHVVINDIIDVSLIGKKPYVKTTILWENFHRIITAKRVYNFTVKFKECILVTGNRKESTDAERLIDAAYAMLNKRVKMQND